MNEQELTFDGKPVPRWLLEKDTFDPYAHEVPSPQEPPRRLGFHRVTFHVGYGCCIDCPDSMGMYDELCGPHSDPCKRNGCEGAEEIIGAAWTRRETYNRHDDRRRKDVLRGFILAFVFGLPAAFVLYVLAWG
jgi:hypothetical protein